MLQSWNQTLINYLGNMYMDIIHSILALIIIILIYSFGSFFIKRKINEINQKRQILVNFRNICVIMFFLIEIFLWSGEIKTLLISATAIFAAFLVSFRDLLMSFVASLFISSHKLFNIGNTIQVGEIKGKVLDKNLFFTKLSVKDGLGKKELLIPNKFFIDTSFINFSYGNEFSTLTLELVIPNIKRVQEISNKIEIIIKEISKEQEKIYNEQYNESNRINFFIESINKFYEIKFIFDSENSKIIVQSFIKDNEKIAIEKKIMDIYFEEILK